MLLIYTHFQVQLFSTSIVSHIVSDLRCVISVTMAVCYEEGGAFVKVREVSRENTAW